MKVMLTTGNFPHLACCLFLTLSRLTLCTGGGSKRKNGFISNLHLHWDLFFFGLTLLMIPTSHRQISTHSFILAHAFSVKCPFSLCQCHSSNGLLVFLRFSKPLKVTIRCILIYIIIHSTHYLFSDWPKA